MNLPTPRAIAQKRAQKMRRGSRRFCPPSARANVALPVDVPSFKLAGGNVTCYPSPMKRPVGSDGGPSFFGPGACCPEKKREEARKSCVETKLWRSASWPWRRCRAVLEIPIWTARPLARASVPWVPRLSAATWRSARASERLPVRFATTSASATDPKDTGRLTGRHHSIQKGSFRRPPGWSFFVFACAQPRGAGLRRTGDRCSRNC